MKNSLSISFQLPGKTLTEQAQVTAVCAGEG